ncbi:hypothetical protein J1G44_16720 [Cellulomonas sp. zg-ZUI199]|uniref:CYTH domain-containing protein n=1 Tax=Cellulomonas wangleii TaxID=2816956 RepID=A0ABX8D5A7_9CELL|nr:hypothetical protein [Cellulomonas wangleii]MBO0926122.1 hypothetical protein [Cellulomonas wangleii]QVI62640.1 hypothetical protein KG103_01435 [Cellulomonas wangleii]
MFEFRVGESYAGLSALFGEGIRLASKFYVEDPETGSLLVRAGGVGREERGEALLLRWHGRPIGLEAHVTRRDDEHGAHSLATLSELGTSSFARLATGVPHVELTPEDATRAMHVAAEAFVVYATHLGFYGPGIRVIDPLDPDRELSPTDFGYGEIAPEWWNNR